MCNRILKTDISFFLLFHKHVLLTCGADGYVIFSQTAMINSNIDTGLTRVETNKMASFKTMRFF